MAQKAKKQSVDIFPHIPLMLDNPAIDIPAVVELLEGAKDVLFIGHHNWWVAIAVALACPEIEVHGLDEKESNVLLARELIEQLGVRNLTYREQTFDAFLRTRGNWKCDVVLYIPKFHCSRPIVESYYSRIHTVLRCHQLLPKGGTFIMQAAFGSVAGSRRYIDTYVVEDMLFHMDDEPWNTTHLQSEINRLRGCSYHDLGRFFLTHGGMCVDEREHVAHQVCCEVSERVVDELSGHVYEQSIRLNNEYQVLLTNHDWEKNYLMVLADYTLFLRKTLRMRVESRLYIPVRMRRVVQHLYGVSHEVLQNVHTTGLIVAHRT